MPSNLVTEVVGAGALNLQFSCIFLVIVPFVFHLRIRGIHQQRLWFWQSLRTWPSSAQPNTYDITFSSPCVRAQGFAVARCASALLENAALRYLPSCHLLSRHPLQSPLLLTFSSPSLVTFSRHRLSSPSLVTVSRHLIHIASRSISLHPIHLITPLIRFFTYIKDLKSRSDSSDAVCSHILPRQFEGYESRTQTSRLSGLRAKLTPRPMGSTT